MGKYYYLVAGLPKLALEDNKLSYTVADFKEDIYPALTVADKKLVSLFFLQYDNANVGKLLLMGVESFLLKNSTNIFCD